MLIKKEKKRQLTTTISYVDKKKIWQFNISKYFEQISYVGKKKGGGELTIE